MRWCEICNLRIATEEPTSADGALHESCARIQRRKAIPLGARTKRIQPMTEDELNAWRQSHRTDSDTYRI